MERLNLMMSIDEALTNGKKLIQVEGSVFRYENDQVAIRDVYGGFIALGEARSATAAAALIIEELNEMAEKERAAEIEA